MHSERNKLGQQLRALPEVSLSNVLEDIKNVPCYRAQPDTDLGTRTYEAANTPVSNRGNIWSAGNVAGSCACWFRQRSLKEMLREKHPGTADILENDHQLSLCGLMKLY